MVILALDHGDRRIGMAVSDPSKSVALGLPTLETDDAGGELHVIKDIVQQRGVTVIVVGLPKHMDGSEGQRARKARGFVKALRRLLPDMPFEFVDERLTSARAHRVLSSEGASQDVRRKNVDRMAAQFILKRYLKTDDPGRVE